MNLIVKASPASCYLCFHSSKKAHEESPVNILPITAISFSIPEDVGKAANQYPI